MLKRLNGEGKPLSTCGKGAKHETSVFSCSACFRECSKCAEHENTLTWCVFMLGVHNGCRKGAKHKKIPMLMSFCARHASEMQERAPSTKRHQCWYLFMFSVHQWVKETCRARKDTSLFVFGVCLW